MAAKRRLASGASAAPKARPPSPPEIGRDRASAPAAVRGLMRRLGLAGASAGGVAGAVLLQAVLDLPDRDAEQLRGARRRPVHLVERPEDRLALDLEEGRAGDERGGGVLVRPHPH